MDEKVQAMLKVIQEDGDTFAKRAEMYYKRRPELISFVEESYKSYRALAERYDKLSTELQNANNTIASIFPEQIQFAMDDEDEACTPKYRKEVREFAPSNAPHIPQVPVAPKKKNIKGMVSIATKKLQEKKVKPAASAVPKSGLTKPEALKEIDRLQKGILILQTEKEFLKSSYEIGMTRCWEIDKQINEMQEKNSRLQDEFNASLVIEDEDARNLMATAALMSCQMKLDKLQMREEVTVEEVREESQRLSEAREEVDSFRINQEKPIGNQKSAGEAVKSATKEDEQELELLRQKMKEQFELGLNPLTVTEMAEKIDELVNKVISLHTVVSSQTALVKRLRSETDELHTKIQYMKHDKETLTSDVTDIEAHHNLDRSFEKLQSRREDKQASEAEVKSQRESRKQEDAINPGEQSRNEAKPQKSEERQTFTPGVTFQEDKTKTEEGEYKKNGDFNTKENRGGEEKVSQSEAKNDPHYQKDSTLMINNSAVTEAQKKTEQEDEPNWKELYLDGMEDKEKALLAKYTAILGKYNEVNHKLGEVEEKTTAQVKDLEIANAKKDEDKLTLLQDEEKDVGKSTNSEHQPASDLSGDQNVEPKARTEEETSTVAPKPTEKEADGEENIKEILIDEARPMSETEEHLRTNINAQQEEHMNFLLRFVPAVHQVEKFQTEVDDLQTEISKLKEKVKKKRDGNASVDSSVKSDARPIYKHLIEIQAELSIWQEENALLKEELQQTLSSLGHIQQEISRNLKEGLEDEEIKFTSYQAATLHGEVANMQQEHKKLAEKLQEGVDHVKELQTEVEKTLTKLNEDFGLAAPKTNTNSELRNSTSGGRVPLQSFIFGVKQKKQKPSIFSCMNPALHKKYGHMKAGPPL